MAIKSNAVVVYLPRHIKQRLQIESVKREITMGSLMGEAALAWLAFTRKKEMERRKAKNEMEEVARLNAEVADIERELDMLLVDRSTTLNRYTERSKKWEKRKKDGTY